MSERAAVLVTATELAAHLADPGLVVLDATVALAQPEFDGDHRVASGRDGWLAQRVPEALLLDQLDEFAAPRPPLHFSRPDEARAASVLRRLGVRDGTDLVVYDQTRGIWAARAWWVLRSLGLPSRVLDGGLAGWVAAGHPVASGPPAPSEELAPVGVLSLHADPTAWASRQDVADIVAGRRDADLLCALDRTQFTGQVPTRYARRGHIPGSRNLPARSFDDESGLLLPSDRIAALAGALTAPDRDVVVYCGGGISAARTALALVVAGYPRVSIYDGSLEEWSADPDLPLVV